MPFGLLFQLFVGPFQVLDSPVVVVLGPAFVSQQGLQFLVPLLLKVDLAAVVLNLLVLFVNALAHGDLFVFEARNFSLKLGLVRFLVVRDTFEGHQLFVDLLAL